MQQGRTAGKKFNPTRFIDYFDCPHAKQKLIAKHIACAGAVTVDDLCTQTGCNRTTVRTTLAEMKRRRFIYVSGWRKTSQSGRAPLFSAGDHPDVERPLPKRAATHAEQNQRLAAHGHVADSMARHCNKLAAALVPRRTDHEQRRVNWQYLAWLFNQSSGARHAA
jgi:hypothetical protein